MVYDNNDDIGVISDRLVCLRLLSMRITCCSTAVCRFNVW